MPGGPVVVLAGGTGGAKLARGLHACCGQDLVVVANTADDVEAYGVPVSPDPDLVTFRLAGLLDERGWGLRDDTFAVMDALRDLGRDVWFNLGDRDLAWCIERARLLAGGATPTAAHAALTAAAGVRARVLPMSDEPVRTEILTGGAWLGIQEFLIRRRGEGPIDDVRHAGIEAARPTPDVLGAIEAARAIVIGPSNPVISIRPILSLAGMAEALRAARAPVVAVSPIVGGHVLKGPTATCMAWAGLPVGAAGIARAYAGIADALVADEAEGVARLPVTLAGTLMDDEDAERRLGQVVLDVAEAG